MSKQLPGLVACVDLQLMVMNGGGQMMQGFPRPGPALKTILIVIGVLGIVLALAFNYVPQGVELFSALTCSTSQVLHWQLWRLVTAGFLTDPKAISHLFFTLIGLYFLSPDLESRWGSWRFARFVLIAMVAGFVLGIVMDLIAPKELGVFHPPLMFGASAAITATALAWSSANAKMQVRLFFVLPVSGRALFWVTIGYCVLGLIYAGSFSEGAAAPFGGLITGLLLGGNPSPLRTLFLKAKLAVFRQRAGRGVPTAHEIATRESSEARRKRGGLRVVYGGLEDDLKKRKVPKDKRYLN